MWTRRTYRGDDVGIGSQFRSAQVCDPVAANWISRVWSSAAVGATVHTVRLSAVRIKLVSSQRPSGDATRYARAVSTIVIVPESMFARASWLSIDTSSRAWSCQANTYAALDAVGVIGHVTSRPSIITTQNSNVSAVRRENATCKPSGLQAGTPSVLSPLVKRETASVRKSRIARLRAPTVLHRADANTTRCPSGDTLGSRSSPREKVSRRGGWFGDRRYRSVVVESAALSETIHSLAARPVGLTAPYSVSTESVSSGFASRSSSGVPTGHAAMLMGCTYRRTLSFETIRHTVN